MIYFIYVFLFIFGCAIGSFLNVVILRLRSGQVCRLEDKESIVRGRSHCVKCGRVLRWHDLIPVISFFLLRGKCRACGQPISWQYPLVEAATGLLFVFTVVKLFPELVEGSKMVLDFAMLRSNNILFLFYWFYIICSLIIIFVYDLRHYIIPDVVLFLAIGVASVFRILNLGFFSNFEFRISNFETLLNPIFSALGASAFFLLLILITRGQGMGLGDAKLAVLMGLLLGWPNILIALFLAFFSGALVGVALIILKRKTLKSQVPFGPFLIFGTLAALFWGQIVTDFYAGFLM